MFEIVLRTIINVHGHTILDFPITYINDSVRCQSECACLHKTVNRIHECQATVPLLYELRKPMLYQQFNVKVSDCLFHTG